MKKGDIIYWRDGLGVVDVGRITSVKPDAQGGGYCNCTDRDGRRAVVPFERIINDAQAYFGWRNGREVETVEDEIRAAEKAVEDGRQWLSDKERSLAGRKAKLELVKAKTFHDYMPKWEESK